MLLPVGLHGVPKQPPDPLPQPAEALMPVVLGGGPSRRTWPDAPPGRTPRPAAVLVLLYPAQNQNAPVPLAQ